MADNPYESQATSDALAEPKPRGGRLIEILVVVGILGMLVLLLLPAGRRNVPETTRRMRCKNNLKQLSLAIHNYHDVHGRFPPAFTVDANGNRLHSWRTLLLPYITSGPLYKSIDLSKPWNHPTNSVAFNADVEAYGFQCHSADLPKGHTIYHAIIGPDAFFSDNGKPRTLDNISDGIANTLILTEVSPDQSVHWMDPTGDRGYEFLTQQLENAKTAHTGGVQASMADGMVRFLSTTMRPDALEAIITIAGGEPVDEL